MVLPILSVQFFRAARGKTAHQKESRSALPKAKTPAAQIVQSRYLDPCAISNGEKMILFFGTRQVVRDDNRPGEGVRQCPRCGQLVAFRPRRMRTYVHLFWVPLIPIDAWQLVIECPSCRTQFAVAS
jgi:hypothetical protein